MKKVWLVVSCFAIAINFIFIVEMQELPRMYEAKILAERNALLATYKSAAQEIVQDIQGLSSLLLEQKRMICPRLTLKKQLECAVDFWQVELLYRQIIEQAKRCYRAAAQGNLEEAYEHQEHLMNLFRQSMLLSQQNRQKYPILPVHPG